MTWQGKRRQPPICEKCNGLRLSPTVYEGGLTTMPLGGGQTFWVDGVEHYHNADRTSQDYYCSNGHRWGVPLRSPCPSCGFGAR